MKKNRKALLAIEISVLALILATFIFCLVAQLTNPEAPYAVWVKENIWDVQGTIASLKAHVPTLIKSLITIVIIYAVCRILRMIFNAKMKKSNRTKTVFDLLDGFVKYGCAIAIILTVLKACGVDTTALIASVGVLTLVVGLGAQPLIEDIIAGIFIIFENEYNVGEIISINDFRGTVIEIGIRSTKLLDAAGNIKIINNSTIGDVVNLSRENSLAVVVRLCCLHLRRRSQNIVGIGRTFALRQSPCNVFLAVLVIILGEHVAEYGRHVPVLL